MSSPAAGFTLDLSLQVGKYDVQKLLGKGATGTVYLAKDTFSGKEVALKTIEPEVFRDPEFGTVYRSQFLNEASLAGKSNGTTLLGAQIFFWARVAYALVYIGGLPWIRTGVWAVSIVGLAMIFLQLI